MTPLDSKVRLALYIAGNVVQAAVAGVVSVDFKDTKAVLVFVLGLAGVAITTARSYIDKSPAQIVEPPKP